PDDDVTGTAEGASYGHVGYGEVVGALASAATGTERGEEQDEGWPGAAVRVGVVSHHGAPVRRQDGRGLPGEPASPAVHRPRAGTGAPCWPAAATRRRRIAWGRAGT